MNAFYSRDLVKTIDGEADGVIYRDEDNDFVRIAPINAANIVDIMLDGQEVVAIVRLALSVGGVLDKEQFEELVELVSKKSRSYS